MFGQPQPVVRLSRPTDINNLRDLDVKCYDYPINMEQWKTLVESSGKAGEARCVLVEYQSAIGSNKPIGFGVWQYHDGDFLILRIGTVKQYRRRGIGHLIMDAIVKDASKKGIKTIKITVPDIHCQPGDPDDVSAYLVKMGFKTTGLIYSDWKFMFGQYRDGYEFALKLGEE